MNPSTFTAQPYLYDQQQRQPPQPAQEMASQSHDPSQSLSEPHHDQSQSSQDYYAYYQHQYPYYYNQDFSNTYYPQQQHSQESTPVHPPGVAVAPATAAPLVASEPTQMQYHQNAYYYPQGFVEQQQQQGSYSDFASQGFQGQQWGVDTNAPPVYGGPGFVHPPRQSSYRGGGRRGGRKGGGRSHFAPPNVQAHAFPVWPPPQLAWCELCRVDCNTIQILEQHRNGKKHKKNLQRLEELQNLNKVITETRNVVPLHKPTSQLRPTAMEPEKGPVSEEKQATPQDAPPEAVTGTNTFETATQQSMEKTTMAVPAEEKEKSPRTNNSGARGRSFKRSMRGGRGAHHKRMRINELRRQPVEPPKPKVVTQLVCELCNVKCESQVVFETHLAGKKHTSKVKRLPGYQAIVGATAQALQPPNPKAPSSLLKFQVKQQGLHAKEAAGGPAAPEPEPAQALYLESKNQPDSVCHHGVQAISETETLDVRQDEEENGQQKTRLIESETASAATVGLKIDEGSLGSEGGKVTPSENSSVDAGQEALCFKAIDEARALSSPQVVLSEQESKNKGLEVEEDDPSE